MLKTFDNFVILPQLVTTVFISVGGKQEIGAVKGQFAVIEMDQEEGSQARIFQDYVVIYSLDNVKTNAVSQVSTI